MKILSNRQSLTKYLNYCSNEMGTPLIGQIGEFSQEGNAKPKSCFATIRAAALWQEKALAKQKIHRQ